MKATEQYFFCGTVYYAAVQGGSNFGVWRWIKSNGVIIHMKASKQYFAAVAVFIILFKVFLTSETMDETLRCDQSN